KIQTTTPSIGDEVFSAGFRSRSLGVGKIFSQGKLVALNGPEGTWITDLSSGPGGSGAPVSNADGLIVGYVVGIQFDNLGSRVGTLVRPISEITDVLRNAGVNL
ncbi:hypothetical protein, partial [uncultured Ruegeria sp.]|uniref:hypothetical protein n=1 Tax=uncultured Ruegeria sp. TaxID=259304 RepID=UPI002627699A